jgi:hypothetical protein
MKELPLAWLKGLVGFVGVSSRYSAAGLTFGALAMFVAPWLRMDPWAAFFAGFLLPFGPLYFWFTSDKAMGRRLGTLKKWKDDGVLTENEHDALRADAIRWYSERVYGKSAPAAAPGRQAGSQDRRKGTKSAGSAPAAGGQQADASTTGQAPAPPPSAPDPPSSTQPPADPGQEP